MAYIAGKNATARLKGTLDVGMAKIPADNDNNHIADSGEGGNHRGDGEEMEIG